MNSDRMDRDLTREYPEDMQDLQDLQDAVGPAGEAADAAADPELSVEEAFAQLEELVKRMEEDGISLEESFACYEKGIRLVRFCNDRIDRVEKKVRILRGEDREEEDQDL